MKALVVHSRRTGLGLIRSLGKKKVEVYVADTFKSAGFYSKFTKSAFVVPKIIDVGENIFLEKLLAIGKKCGNGEKLFLFTPSDDYLLFFVKYWKELSPYFIETFETKYELLRDNLEKTRIYKIAEKAKVPFPYSYYTPINIEDIEYPVVIKPTLKKTSEVDVVKEAFRIRICHDKKELLEAMTLLDKINIDYVVQKFISGYDDQLYTAGVFAYKGHLIASATARKLRQFPPNTGECSYGELVNEKTILEYAKRYLKTSKITGICQIEFKKNNSEFYLMEINPRPWSWNSIIEYSGVNLPYIACITIKNKDLTIKKGNRIRNSSLISKLLTYFEF